MVLLAAALAVAAGVLLQAVLATVALAVTLAYVLYPLRQWVARRVGSDWLAAASVTAVAGLGGAVLLAPVAFVAYERRAAAFAFVRSLPAALSIPVGETTLVIETAPVIEQVTDALTALAVLVARTAPIVALQAVVFVLVTFAVLYKPDALRRAAIGVVPPAYHDVLAALHRRTADTLRAIYVLQAVTALATFLLAFAVFVLFGYRSPLFLAVLAGVLQFVPVLGPSLLVLALVVVEAAAGEPIAAAVLAVVGLVVIGFLPDAVIRTRLARYTTDLPASLYFVGFVGGVLTVGPVGFVLGPLVVALLVEVISLLSVEAERGDVTLAVESEGEG